MFQNLSDKLLSGLKKIRGQGKITPENIEGALKEIRLGLLEADVNFKVVKQFISQVQAKAFQYLGAEMLALDSNAKLFLGACQVDSLHLQRALLPFAQSPATSERLRCVPKLLCSQSFFY